MCTNQQRDSLPLCQTRVPRRPQRLAIIPFEVVVPDGESTRVRLETFIEPIRREYDAAPIFLCFRSTKEIEIAESPLRDGNRVVLHPDGSAVIQHRNAALVERTGVMCLLAER